MKQADTLEAGEASEGVIPGERIAIGTLVMLAWGYVLYRAVVVVFTGDECGTYLRHIVPLTGLLDFSTANNHFLNSLLASVTYRLFGNAEWVLRLPNVLAFGAYAVFASRLTGTGTLASPAVRIVSLIALLSNVFVLEHFALCRGYGLALGLLMPALWCLARQVREPGQLRWTWGGMLLAALAVLASFTFLLPFVAIGTSFATLHVWHWRCPPARRSSQSGGGTVTCWKLAQLSRKTTAWRPRLRPSRSLRRQTVVLSGESKSTETNHRLAAKATGARTDSRLLRPFVAIGLPAAFLAIAIVRPLWQLRSSGELYIGGDRGFILDTVHNLLVRSIGMTIPAGLPLRSMRTLLLVACVAAGAGLIWRAWRRRDRVVATGAAISVVLLVSCVLSIIQHHLLGIPYLKGRAALFLIPLTLWVLVYGADQLARLGRWPRMLAVAALLLVAGMQMHTLARSDAGQPISGWESAEGCRTVARELFALQPDDGGAVEVAIDWRLYFMVAYYLERFEAGHVSAHQIVGPPDAMRADMYFAQEDQKPSGEAFAPMKRYAPAGVLYMNTNRLARMP